MTLNLMMISPRGMWQSSDFRLTDLRTGRMMADWSLKHVSIICPDGKALLTYTGVGTIPTPDGKGWRSVAEWVARTLHGETRTVRASVEHLTQEWNKIFRPIRPLHHIFMVGAFIRERPWYFEVNNCQPRTDWSSHPPKSEFGIAPTELTEPQAYVGGCKHSVPKADVKTMVRLARVWPKSPDNYSELLAQINRRTAPWSNGRVGPECVVSFLRSDGEGGVQSKSYTWGKKCPSKVWYPLTVLFGIDIAAHMGDYTKQWYERRQAEHEKAAGSAPPPSQEFR